MNNRIRIYLQLLLMSFCAFAVPVQALVLLDSYSNGQGAIQDLSGASDLVLSPDQKFLYACAFNSAAVSAFSRDTSTGKLTFLASYKQGVGGVSGLQGALSLRLSPDGAHLYVVGFSAHAVAVFSRNASDGRLTFVQAVANDGSNGLYQVNNLAFDATGTRLYSISTNALSLFYRDTSTGQLSFVVRYLTNQPGFSGIGGATSAAVSSDGKMLYVTGRSDNSLAFFRRDPNSGVLSFWAHIPNGINGVTGLGGAYDVQISPDGSLVFVSGNTDAAIVVFARESDGSLRYLRTYKEGVGGVSGLLGVQRLALSRDGKLLVAVANSDNALAVFDVRGATVAAGPLAFNHVARQGQAGISGLSGVSAAVLDDQAQQLYSSALNASSISRFSVNSANLSVTVSAPAEAQIGADFNYSVRVDNLGPGSAAAVTLTTTLPTQLSLNTQGTDVRCSATGAVVTCALGAIAAGQSADVSLSVKTNSAGTASAQFKVSSTEPDSNSANNSASSGTLIIDQQLTADLGVALTVDHNPVNLGSSVTYQIQVSNAGPVDANTLVVLFTQPSGTSVVNTQSSQATCNAVGGNQVRCTLNLLKANNNSLINITLLSPNQATDMTARVTVSASEIDLQKTNNSQNLTSRAESLTTDLALTGAFPSLNSVAVGQLLTYEAGVRNLATAPAKNLVLEATLTPASGLRYVSASTTKPDVTDAFNICSDQGQGVVRCALGTLNALANPVTVQLSVLPLSAGTLDASFKVSNSDTDTDLSNNQLAANQVTVTGDAIDLALTMAAATPNPAFIGNPLNFGMTITNTHATALAKNASVSISLPTSVDYIGATANQGTGCNETAGTVVCNLGNIAATGSIALTLTVRPTSNADVQVSALLRSDSFDANSANNSANRSVTVQTATADLKLTGSLTPALVTQDDELAFSFSVTNQGPSQANNAQFELQLPALSFSLLSAKIVGGSDCTLENTLLRCSLGRLAALAQNQIEVRLQPHEAGTFATTANLQSTVQDTNTANNSLSLSSRVSAPVALSQGLVYFNAANGISGLQSPFDLALSQDGKFLYASSFNLSGVLVLQRDLNTGALTFVQFLSKADAGVTGLGGAGNLILSPDESWLYVVGFNDDRLVALRRDASSGKLTFAQAIKGDEVGVTALQAPFAVAVWENFVYLADFNADAVLVFQQRGSGGSSNLQGLQNLTGDGLNGVNSLAFNPDGTQLYACASLDSSLVVLARDASTGMLRSTQVLRNATTTSGISGLGGASALLVSPDKQFVYVAGGAEDALAVFQRGADQSLQFLQVLNDGLALNNITDLALSLDGKSLYAAATDSNALTLLSRNPSNGQLTLQSSLINGTAGVQGLSGIRALSISPNGQQVYAASLNSNAISLFGLPSADLSLQMSSVTNASGTGQELTYNLLLNNLGPDRATATELNLAIPAGLSVSSFTTSSGSCQQHSGNIPCRLGSLDKNSTKNVSISLVAQSAGNFNLTATASASQTDPQPNNNSATVPINIAGNANLVVSLGANPAFAVQGAEILYQISLINAGPDSAHQIVLRDTLPPQVAFISAQLGSNACSIASGIVTCTLDNLAYQASVNGEIRVLVQDNSAITNSLEVTSASVDLSLPNQAAVTSPRLQRLISTFIDNSGQVLRDLSITSTGIVHGGTLGGIVQNQGRIESLTLNADAQVSGGGLLVGSISNQGVVRDAQLASGAVLSGGRVQGLLQGESVATPTLLPKLTNAVVAAGAQLRGVLIDNSVTLEPGAQLGVGVKFSNTADIPLNQDLSSLFPPLKENDTGGQALDLNNSLTPDTADTALNGMANAPDIAGFRFEQLASGQIYLAQGSVIISATPQKVTRQGGSSSSLVLTPEGTVLFNTTNGYQVLLQPALRTPQAFAQMLTNTFTLTATSQTDGMITIPLPANSGRLLVRPDWFSTPAGSTDPGGSPGVLGFQPAAGFAANINDAVLFFDDALGGRLQQILYPAPAKREAWQAAADSGLLSQLTLTPDGRLSFTQNGRTYQGVFDYIVLPGTPTQSNTVKWQESTESNGQQFLLVSYPNGEQQKLFLK